MKTKTYNRNDELFLVEECTRNEIKEIIDWALEGIWYCKDPDTTVAVLYKDGTWHIEDAYSGHDNSFRKTNIVLACVTNSATQQVFGKYSVDENGIVEAA